METERIPNITKNFNFEGKEQSISFIETTHVTDGVDCDVYTFEGDKTKDLGIIRIAPNKETPLQRVLNGDKTVEGYVSGKGKLTVTKIDGNQETFNVNDSLDEPLKIEIQIGELMQWKADENIGLTVYEICFPPYQDGRYENIK